MGLTDSEGEKGTLISSCLLAILDYGMVVPLHKHKHIASPSNKNHYKSINRKVDNTVVMLLILLNVLIHMWAFM